MSRGRRAGARGSSWREPGPRAAPQSCMTGELQKYSWKEITTSHPVWLKGRRINQRKVENDLERWLEPGTPDQI